jgi:hypothetical protein
VIGHCGLRFRIRDPSGRDDRFLYLGDDEDGVELEVMAVDLDDGDLLVIHAMRMRARYRNMYEEAKRWRV